MKCPKGLESVVILPEVVSTQDLAIEAVKTGQREATAWMASHQTAGRGRFQRAWHSNPGESFALSIVFWDYADHSKPWLIGMAAALAAAGATHGKVRWPNDIVLENKKLGGVLTEVITDPEGRRIPVVGIGINLMQTEFPAEIAEIATSLSLHRPNAVIDASRLAKLYLDRLNQMPEPENWSALRSIWMHFDQTPGKEYKLHNGDVAVGIGIGPEGELICAVEGETQNVLVADALFGVQK